MSPQTFGPSQPLSQDLQQPLTTPQSAASQPTLPEVPIVEPPFPEVPIVEPPFPEVPIVEPTPPLPPRLTRPRNGSGVCSVC